ncbi:MAG: large subunit ribosomal protein [Patescibacteria group bacterium]|nr:large subunit ribosomal protein [Patescibacteria group bacterium]
MNDTSLKLEERTLEGKKVTKLREAGLVPSVVYGGQAKPIMLQSPIVETTKLVHVAGKHTPVNLMINGKKKLAIIKNIDIDPVRHELRHLAFHTVKQNDIITTEVPIVLIGQGESLAEKAGLVILQAMDQIEIKAKPADLPESIEVSIVDLATDEDKLVIGDIKLPKGVEFADIDQDMELAIASVYEPSALQAANEATGGDEDADIDDVEVETDTTEEKVSEE